VQTEPGCGDNGSMASMQLQDILFSQGFGTRRVCAGLIQQGFVAVAHVPCADPAMEFVADGLQFTVQGVDWATMPRLT
jgi:16S rRNA pseudouridine516 synthase